jgi:hypothetical protein
VVISALLGVGSPRGRHLPRRVDGGRRRCHGAGHQSGRVRAAVRRLGAPARAGHQPQAGRGGGSAGPARVPRGLSSCGAVGNGLYAFPRPRWYQALSDDPTSDIFTDDLPVGEPGPSRFLLGAARPGVIPRVRRASAPGVATPLSTRIRVAPVGASGTSCHSPHVACRSDTCCTRAQRVYAPPARGQAPPERTTPTGGHHVTSALVAKGRSTPPALKTRKPTALPVWPLTLHRRRRGLRQVLLRGRGVELSPLIGHTYAMEIGEASLDPYGAMVDLNRFDLLEHDGTYADIAGQLWAAVEAPRVDPAKPNLMIVDGGSGLWDLLVNENQIIANDRARGTTAGIGEDGRPTSPRTCGTPRRRSGWRSSTCSRATTARSSSPAASTRSPCSRAPRPSGTGRRSGRSRRTSPAVRRRRRPAGPRSATGRSPRRAASPSSWSRGQSRAMPGVHLRQAVAGAGHRGGHRDRAAAVHRAERRGRCRGGAGDRGRRDDRRPVEGAIAGAEVVETLYGLHARAKAGGTSWAWRSTGIALDARLKARADELRKGTAERPGRGRHGGRGEARRGRAGRRRRPGCPGPSAGHPGRRAGRRAEGGRPGGRGGGADRRDAEQRGMLRDELDHDRRDHRPARRHG